MKSEVDRKTLNILERFVGTLSSVTNLSELGSAVETIVDNLVHAEYTGFYLFDHHQDRLKLLFAKGFTPEERAEAERTAMDRHPGAVFKTRLILHVPDTRREPSRSTSSARGFTVRSRLYLPVMSHDDCIGCFGLASSKPNAFSYDHIHVLRSVGNMASAVYQNLRSKEKIERLRHKQADRLASRYEFQELLTEISADLMRSPTVETDAAIEDALGKVGAFGGADHCYIFQFSDDGRRMSNTHEWCAPGADPQKRNLQDLDADAYTWWIGKLRSLEYIHVPSVGDMPPEANAEKEVLESQNICSVLVLPMMEQGRLIGHFGLDWVQHAEPLDGDMIPLLQLVGDILFGALGKVRSSRELWESEQRMELALHGADLGTWDWSAATGEIIYNLRATEMLGYDPEEFADNEQLSETLIHPDDREAAFAARNAHLEGEIAPYESTHRLRHKSGDWVWVLDKGRVIEREGDGRPPPPPLRHTPRRHRAQALRRGKEEAARPAQPVAKNGGGWCAGRWRGP